MAITIGPGISIGGGIGIGYQLTPFLYIDAGSTASYPGTGSTWNDLSGSGYNFTLYNSPAFVNAGAASYFSFVAASSQYGNSSYLQPAYVSSTVNTTWNVWFRYAGTATATMVGCRNSGASGADTVNFTRIRAGGEFIWYRNSTNLFTPSSWSPAFNTNTWYNACYTITNGIVQTYLNGAAYGPTLDISATPKLATKSPFFLGGDPNAAEYANVNLGVVQLFSRALTSTEISVNFNALRGRYGI
jgi:hypothetical protein